MTLFFDFGFIKTLLFFNRMKFFLKNSGILLVLIGAFVLIVPYFTYLQTNASLLTGWLLIVIGFVSYIVINKLIK